MLQSCIGDKIGVPGGPVKEEASQLLTQLGVWVTEEKWAVLLPSHSLRGPPAALLLCGAFR